MARKKLDDFSFFVNHEVNPTSSVIFFLTVTAMIFSQSEITTLTLVDQLERKQKLYIDDDLYATDKGKIMLGKLSIGNIYHFKNLTFDERTGTLKVNKFWFEFCKFIILSISADTK